MGYKKKYEKGVVFYNKDGTVYRKVFTSSNVKAIRMIHYYMRQTGCLAERFNLKSINK